MKKKSIYFCILMLVGAFAAGCGSSQEAAETTTAAPEVTTAAEAAATETQASATIAATAAESTVETSAEAVAETSAADFDETPVFDGVNINLHPVLTEHYEVAQYTDNTFFYEITGQLLSLNEEESKKYPNLDQALKEDYNNFVTSNMAEFVPAYREAAKELNIEYAGYKPYVETVKIIRMDEHAASLVAETYQYLGGAHGSTATMTFNYDLSTIGNIELSSLVKDEQKLAQALVQRLKSDYPENEHFSLEEDISKYKVSDIPGTEWAYTWAYDYDGLIFIFDEDRLAPHACGAQTIKLRFDEYPDVIVDKYGSEPDRIAKPVDYVQDLQFAGHSITYMPRMNEYDQIDRIEVAIDGKNYEIPAKYVYQLESYAVKAGDKLYFYLFSQGEDDEALFTSYEYTGSGLELKYELEGDRVLENEKSEALMDADNDSYHIAARDLSCPYLLDPSEVTVEHFSGKRSTLVLGTDNTLSVK